MICIPTISPSPSPYPHPRRLFSSPGGTTPRGHTTARSVPASHRPHTSPAFALVHFSTILYCIDLPRGDDFLALLYVRIVCVLFFSLIFFSSFLLSPRRRRRLQQRVPTPSEPAPSAVAVGVAQCTLVELPTAGRRRFSLFKCSNVHCSTFNLLCLLSVFRSFSLFALRLELLRRLPFLFPAAPSQPSSPSLSPRGYRTSPHMMMIVLIYTRVCMYSVQSFRPQRTEGTAAGRRRRRELVCVCVFV